MGATVMEASCVLDAQAVVGEGAVWCMDSRKLLWVDVWKFELHRYDPESGIDEKWTFAEKVGCVAPVDAERVLVGQETGVYLFNTESGSLDAYHRFDASRLQNRCNDSVVDRSGRFWCGTMNLAGLAGPATGELYSFDRGESSLHLEGLRLVNGLACSPDGRLLYLSDSHPDVRSIWQFDLDPPSGRIANRRLFFDCAGMPGRPDGATVDIDGCYWICAVDGWEVLRITPDGRVDRRIALPVAKPSKVAIGGSRLDTLFITSIAATVGAAPARPQQNAGGLFAVHVGPIGMPSPAVDIGHAK